MAGSLEVGFTRAFALQFDAAYYSFNDVNESGRNVTMHAVFHTGSAASLGAFVGNDGFAGDNNTFYGVEGGMEFTGLNAEAYLSSVEDGGISGTLFGFNLHHDFGNEFGIRGRLDRASFDNDIDLTRLSVGLEYDVSPTAQLYGEIGTIDADFGGLSGSESFIGIGAKINFGAQRGTTFKRRGLLEIIPGL
jgi:hypothetical protein